MYFKHVQKIICRTNYAKPKKKKKNGQFNLSKKRSCYLLSNKYFLNFGTFNLAEYKFKNYLTKLLKHSKHFL